MAVNQPALYPATPALGRPREVDLVVFSVTALALAGVTLGVLASLAGAAKALRTTPVAAAFAFVLMAVLIPAGCLYSFRSAKRLPDSAFIGLIASLWLVSRWIVVFAFPGYVPTGDEENLHRFVVALANGGLGARNLAGLSSLYDYPVWLSRAFPIYYPLRVWFGEADLLAVRLVNAAFGAGTLVFTFLIARRLVGSAYAGAAAWLLTLFPYHIFDVLSYTPQIPGTLFFVAGVWVIAEIAGKRPTWPSAIRNGVALGCLMLLAGIQRGGIDLLLGLLFAVMLVLYWFKSGRAYPCMGSAAAATIAIVVWWPASSAFNEWIRSHDVQHQRSHVLGFMTRGWSVASLGEYLGRYEQLDIASRPQEKQRVLLSVLATEIVRQPVATLIAVPIAKTGKFFSPGYAAFAEQGLATGGYDRAARLEKVLTVAYAPIALLLCCAGLMAAFSRGWLAWRAALPVGAIVLAAGAIVLAWETSPRYSHCIHFALVIIAAVGFGALRGGLGLFRSAGHVRKRLAITAAATGLFWIAFGATAYASAAWAKRYHFNDLRQMAVETGGHPLALSPLSQLTNAWEQVVTINPTVAPPVTLQIDLPETPEDEGSRESMSIWLPETPLEPWLSYRIVIPEYDGSARTYSFRELAHMKRGFWRKVSGAGGRESMEIELLPPDCGHCARPDGPIRLAIGYMLAEAR